MVFLDIKVFQQDYMAFCDNFAANPRYPPQAREEARRRKDAIYPYLGQPILHGGVSHNGFMLNVFIDKGSSAVIHWESKREPG